MGIEPILDKKDVQQIYHSALKVLSEVGIQCGHKKMVDILSQKGRIRYDNGRIYLYTDVIDDYFNKRKLEIASRHCDNEFKMGGQWHSWELCDPVFNRPRPATLEESVQMAKLAEMLGSVGDPIPVTPGGTDPGLHTLLSIKIGLLHTRTLGGKLTATDREEIRILSDMYKAAGRKYTIGVEWLISPLKLNSELINTYFEWCDDPDVDISIMSNIPMAGATAPLVFPANLVLSLAETLALDYISQTVSDGRLEDFSIRLEPFDLKDSNIVFGSPEWCLFKQAVVELYEGIIGKKPGGIFRTNGKVVDGQTLMERTASFLWQAMIGLRTFSAVGQLCVDEVYSPVQAILDREILKYGQRLCKGINGGCWDDSLDALRIIKEGIDEDTFISHETTFNVFREMYDFSRLTSACNLSAWKSGGSTTLEAKAWEEAQNLISKHDFSLDEASTNEIEKIYQKGVNYICQR